MRVRTASLVALLVFACSAKGEQSMVLVMPEMAYSVPFDPYDPNPNTEHGQTLLTPPEGSLPVGATRFDYGATREETTRAGLEVKNPMSPSKQNLARGKAVYDVFCTVCHGPGGAGDGPIIGRFPNPPSLLGERARKLADGGIYHIITKGQGIMAPYAVQVRPDDRWHVVNYVRSLQAPAAATTDKENK